MAMGYSITFAQTSNVEMPLMISVDGGTFGKYEVTFKDFKKFVDATGYVTDAEQPDSVNFKWTKQN